METLFGVEMPLWLKFIITMLFVLGLIVGGFWAIRFFGVAGPQFDSMRGRQPRLAVIDAAAVDSRRRLILIRRDNVEHLLMIGGPSDIVIEPNIVRAAQGTRDAPVPLRLSPAAETLPRAPALGETAAWPLQPEAPPRPPRGPQPEESEPWPAESEHPQPVAPAPRRTGRPNDPLAGIAAEAARLPDPRGAAPDSGLAGVFAQREGARQRGEATRERETEREPQRERDGPRVREASLREQAREQAPLREPSEPARERPQREAARLREVPPAPAEDFNADADQNLADMAQRLEAALRRPNKPGEARTAEPRIMSAEPEPPPGPPPRPSAQPTEGKPAKSLYDSLEKEMASLLGRPSGKS